MSYRPFGKATQSPRDWRTSNSSYGGFLQRGRRGPHGWLFRNSRSNVFGGVRGLCGRPLSGRPDQPNFYKGWSAERAAKWTKVPPSPKRPAQARTPGSVRVTVDNPTRVSIEIPLQNADSQTNGAVNVDNNDNLVVDNGNHHDNDTVVNNTAPYNHKPRITSKPNFKKPVGQMLRGNDSRQVAECIVHYRNPGRSSQSQVISTDAAPVPVSSPIPPNTRPASAPVYYENKPPVTPSPPKQARSNDNPNYTGQRSVRKVNFSTRTPTPSFSYVNPGRIPSPDLSSPVVVVASVPPASPQPFSEYTYMCNTGARSQANSSHHEAAENNAFVSERTTEHISRDPRTGTPVIERSRSAQSNQRQNYARTNNNAVSTERVFQELAAASLNDKNDLNLALNISTKEIHPERPSSRGSVRPASAGNYIMTPTAPQSGIRGNSAHINASRPRSQYSYRERQIITPKPAVSAVVMAADHVSSNQAEMITTMCEEKVTTTRNVEVVSRQGSGGRSLGGSEVVQSRVTTSSVEESRSQSRETKSHVQHNAHTNVMHQNWIN